MRQTDRGQVIKGRGQARVVALTPNRARTVPRANQARILQVRAITGGEDEYEIGRKLCRHRCCQGSRGCCHSPEWGHVECRLRRGGVSELVSSLRTAEPAAVLLEATGGLEVPLVSALAAAALPVVVVKSSSGTRLRQSHRQARQDGRSRCPGACPLRRGCTAARAPIAR